MSAIAFGGVTGRMAVHVEQEPHVSAKDAVDHLLLGVADREAGIRWIEERTGVRAVIGGSHPGVGTCNALLSLGGRQYLEIIAPDPEQTQLAARYQILRSLNTPRLITWAAATDNAETTSKRCREAGLDVLGPTQGSRQRPDGKMMRWVTLSVTTEFETVIPFFIEWDRTVTHPAADSPQGCRLQTLTFTHRQPARVREMLARMGIDATVTTGVEGSLMALLQTPKGALELR
jgi:Glyoxalase-like domain